MSSKIFTLQYLNLHFRFFKDFSNEGFSHLTLNPCDFGFKKKPPKKVSSKVNVFYMKQVFINWFTGLYKINFS